MKIPVCYCWDNFGCMKMYELDPDSPPRLDPDPMYYEKQKN